MLAIATSMEVTTRAIVATPMMSDTFREVILWLETSVLFFFSVSLKLMITGSTPDYEVPGIDYEV